MRRGTKFVVGLIIVVMLTSLLLFSGQRGTSTGAVIDPWGNREVLNYLFWTAYDVKLSADIIKLQKDLGLSDAAMAELKQYGMEEGQRLMGIELVPDTGETAATAGAANARWAAVFATIDEETKETLGTEYPAFRTWIQTWWQEETIYRQNWIKEQEDAANKTDAAIDRELVYATQYTGYTSFEVALPDRYVKFANLGDGWTGNIPSSLRPYYANPPYTVNVYNEATNQTVLSVVVREAGPWNVDDNYWDAASGSPSRRLFTNLALGMPEAQAAYYNGYNGGKDQGGSRTVLNPAGIDLTLSVASQLGLGSQQNAWVWVRYSALP